MARRAGVEEHEKLLGARAASLARQASEAAWQLRQRLDLMHVAVLGMLGGSETAGQQDADNACDEEALAAREATEAAAAAALATIPPVALHNLLVQTCTLVPDLEPLLQTLAALEQPPVYVPYAATPSSPPF